MFYGPSGAGKKTRIMCVLRELYGSGVEKLKIEQQTFTVSIKKTVGLRLGLGGRVSLRACLFETRQSGWLLLPTLVKYFLLYLLLRKSMTKLRWFILELKV